MDCMKTILHDKKVPDGVKQGFKVNMEVQTFVQLLLQSDDELWHSVILVQPIWV